MTSRIPLGSVAAAMARSGLRVFPCLAGDKRPATSTGWKAATTDTDLVTRWWRACPVFNVGIATDRDLVVIDLDAKTWPPDAGLKPCRDATGADVLLVMAEQVGVTDPSWFWQTWNVLTPTGGHHLYYRRPDGIEVRSSAGTVGPLIDVRARGGYVVGPWSQRPEGTYLPVAGWPHVIEADTDLVEVTNARMTAITGTPPEMPAWLIDLVAVKDGRRAQASHADLIAEVMAALDREPLGLGYADAALRGEVERVRSAHEGTRNDTTNRAAFSLGQLVSVGLLDEDQVTSELQRAAVAAGLPSSEAAAAVASGLTAGKRNPREVVLT